MNRLIWKWAWRISLNWQNTHQTKIWGSSAQSLEQKPQQRTAWGWSGVEKLDMSVLAFLVKSFHWGWLIVLECTELDKLWMQMKTRQWWKPACLGCGESARDVQAAGLLKQKNKKQTKQKIYGRACYWKQSFCCCWFFINEKNEGLLMRTSSKEQGKHTRPKTGHKYEKQQQKKTCSDRCGFIRKKI